MCVAHVESSGGRTCEVLVCTDTTGQSYIQKTGLACWKIPQKIQIFRRKIVLERENYQFCNVFEDQSELKSLAEQVLGFRSYMPLENGREHTINDCIC